jgi:hypothetical protein
MKKNFLIAFAVGALFLIGNNVMADDPTVPIIEPPGVGADKGTLYGNQSGTRYCCCPGTNDCSAAACSNCPQ